MFDIIVPEGHDTMSRVTLGGTVYYIRFTYNGIFDYWSVGLYDEEQNPIVPMTKIVPHFNLFDYAYSDLPEGILMCDSKQDEIHENDFKDKNAYITYIEPEDLL